MGRHSALQCVRRGYRAAWASVGCLDCVRRRTPQIMYVRSLCTGRVPLTEHKKQDGGQEENEELAEFRKGMDIAFHFVCITFGIIYGAFLFFVLRDLIYPSSAPKIYKRALKKCENHPEVIATFGGPINDYAWYPGGKIIQRVGAKRYKRNTVKCIRLTFLISGSKVNEATVHVDLKKNSIRWTYDVHYIIVKFGTDPQRSITVEDNRFDS